MTACGPSEPAAAPTPPPPAPTLSAPPPAAPASASASATASAPAASPKPAWGGLPADLGREGCKAGQANDCDYLAEYWSAREILPAARLDEAKADAETLRAACDKRGIASACMGYALMLKYGSATGARDNDAGTPYWSRVRELNDLNGFRDGASNEGKAALARTRSDCDAGRARACNQLGWAAYNGVQRAKSIRDAYTEYARACELGSAQGCRWAGHYAHLYEEVRNLERSEQHLRKGCEGGNPGACSDLGLLLRDEKKDPAGAYTLFSRACQEGGRAGCTHQGEALLLRKNKDERTQGAALIKSSCEAGEEDGCFAWGKVLEKGDASVKKDLPAAITSYAMACKGRNNDACEALSRVAGANKTSKCVLGPKAKIDEHASKILVDACKREQGAPWCGGVSSCE